MLQKILRLPEVKACSGKGHSSIYAEIAAGTFPKPIPLGKKAVGWLESDILQWQETRIAARDAKAS